MSGLTLKTFCLSLSRTRSDPRPLPWYWPPAKQIFTLFSGLSSHPGSTGSEGLHFDGDKLRIFIAVAASSQSMKQFAGRRLDAEIPVIKLLG